MIYLSQKGGVLHMQYKYNLIVDSIIGDITVSFIGKSENEVFRKARETVNGVTRIIKVKSKKLAKRQGE